MADLELGRTGGVTEREVPVDFEALEDAFENNAPEVHSYLHISTGEVLRVVVGIADPEMHTRIATDVNYLRVDPVSSREQYRWMERFIPMVDDVDLRERLLHAIDGKGAFRRFKDALMAHAQERERWFAFRSERLRVFMEAWLDAHNLRAVARAARPVELPSSPEATAPISQADLGGRRSRSAEGLRNQLAELAESLGARDLEKVMAFAEFIKARRAARAYTTARADAEGERESREIERDSLAGASDEPPSTSRKRSAAGGE